MHVPPGKKTIKKACAIDIKVKEHPTRILVITIFLLSAFLPDLKPDIMNYRDASMRSL